jgi:hypothetical protein
MVPWCYKKFRNLSRLTRPRTCAFGHIFPRIRLQGRRFQALRDLASRSCGIICPLSRHFLGKCCAFIGDGALPVLGKYAR